MNAWVIELLAQSESFMPHGHCYLWIPALLWLHVGSDLLIGTAYLGISVLLGLLVKRLRLPFSPVFVAFGLFIGLCGGTHFMEIWTTWQPDYWMSGLLKAATAAASVATAIGLLWIKPQIETFAHTARLSEERRIRLESTHAELQRLYTQVRELSEARNRFFANVSHELRTPLALIIGPAARLLDGKPAEDPDRKFLQHIRDNAQVLLRHVDDLLDVAKLEAKALQPQYEDVDVPAWVQAIVGRFELGAAHRGIVLTHLLPGSVSAQFDTAQIDRVVTNLLSNAMRFTPDGGRIEVRAAVVDGWLDVSIDDSGLGVAEQDRERIFDRFRQSSGVETTRAHGGTGLGLAIVKEFTELHQGSVQVGGSPLGGARFLVRLPLHAPPGAEFRLPADRPEAAPAHIPVAVAAAVQPAGAAESFQGPGYAHGPERPSVLLVEDNDEMRRFIADVLVDEFSVVAASDGEQALVNADVLRPDLIISDLMMPRLDGEQLIAEIRSRRELEATPVLLLSARSDETTRVRLLQTGADDYVIKPFVPAELRARTRNLVRIKRAADILRSALNGASHDIETLAQRLALRGRQLQAALDGAEVARKQAERANLVKSQFLALISHEMRTPLSTVMLNLQLLTMDRSSPLPATAGTRVTRATVAARQLQSTIDGLLKYVQVESGRLETRFDYVDVPALAAETVEEFRIHTEGKPVELSVDLPPEPVPPTRTDPRLLKVILGNLLSNAIKYTQRGTIRVSTTVGPDSLALVVQDTGIGIAPADLDRVFEPFEQIEPLTRKSIPGVGIGLTLVRELAAQLGGRVELASQPQVGTTFRVILPLTALEPAERSPLNEDKV